MTENDKKILAEDNEGLLTYEYLANHIGQCDSDLDAIIENLRRVDLTGQYMASAARYLHAIDPQCYAEAVRMLTALTIDRDREHRYLPSLMVSLYGDDFHAHATQLSQSDNNFRRMYKRLYPTSVF